MSNTTNDLRRNAHGIKYSISVCGLSHLWKIAFQKIMRYYYRVYTQYTVSKIPYQSLLRCFLARSHPANTFPLFYPIISSPDMCLFHYTFHSKIYAKLYWIVKYCMLFIHFFLTAMVIQSIGDGEADSPWRNPYRPYA
jgi:hypothetical protein